MLLPLTPGTVYTYIGRKDGLRASDTFEVTHERAVVDGVSTTVVHDQLRLAGKLREKTIDWYAQDKTGNVWYLGEATETLTPKGERESTEGSWKAGEPTEGGGGAIAQPGIFLNATPRPHLGFKQELAAPVAADQFEALSLKAAVTVPYITSTRALLTKETTPLEKGVVDNKYYVLGVGTVLEATAVGPEERLELAKVMRP